MNLTENELEEKKIQEKINKAIDSFENIKFDAGAGAGKTYALIESLKYILKTNVNRLESHNQYIMCITYTNIAKNEIVERLGNSSIIKVSTIHERLWSLIKDYQKQLVEIHYIKLKKELENLKNKLEIEKKFKVYRDFNDKNEFKNIIIENKDIFYSNIDKKSTPFKKEMKTFLNDNYNELLKSIGNFKKIVKTIYKIDNYQTCLDRIIKNHKKYQSIKYNSKYNSDILHKMLISHDTLIEYSLEIIKKYDLLKQIIIDTYPYILIDEYQDTDKKVIEIMSLLSEHSEKIKHNLFIGYFGDTAQNIYDKGVGNEIDEIHPNLKQIDKNFNRRSYKEIIDIINKIRKDHIQQVSIDNKTGGSVEFYYGEDKQSFIEKCKKDWNINRQNRLHCLVLTNKLVAEYSGFKNLYKQFSETDYYRKNFKQLKDELLSNNIMKLGKIQNLFYKIIKFKKDTENPKTPITEFLNTDKVDSNFTFTQLKEIINIFKSIQGNSLKEYIKSIFEQYEKCHNKDFKNIINELMNLEEDSSYQSFFNYLLNELFPNPDNEESNNKITNLLQINFKEYLNWYEFIKEEQDKEVEYHTYHGTKGKEYENVIIIMKNDFRGNDKKFSSFFKNIDNPKDEDIEEFNNTKNLLYVSSSRAKKNLRILYLDDISDFKEGIEKIFGQLKEYK